MEMNRKDREKRSQVIATLIFKGNSIRAMVRMIGVAMNIVVTETCCPLHELKNK